MQQARRLPSLALHILSAPHLPQHKHTLTQQACSLALQRCCCVNKPQWLGQARLKGCLVDGDAMQTCAPSLPRLGGCKLCEGVGPRRRGGWEVEMVDGKRRL